MAKNSHLPTISDLNFKGLKVLIRVDFNLPHDEHGKVKDDARVRSTVPTLKYLLDQGATLILMAHHSKKGQSLRPAAQRLERLIQRPVEFIENFWEEKARQKIRNAKPGSITMLENLRFHKGEKLNDPDLGKWLASLADIYVNDAFGNCHRAHASMVSVPTYLPGAIGFLLEKEIQEIEGLLKEPQHPFVAIIGGSKIATKLGMINKLLDKADTVLLGGGVANTFFRAWGIEIGKSLADEEMVEVARTMFWKASRQHTAMILPEDVTTAHAALRNGVANIHHTKIHPDHAIYDIGQNTSVYYRQIILQAKTIVWNGPMGVYEDPLFQKGTGRILQAVVDSPARSIVGGGDTIVNIKDPKYFDQISHVSTGGGAMLELIEKGTLPALDALKTGSAK